MNKEINSNNYQDSPHHEGQQQNVANDRQGKGINQTPTQNDQQEGRLTRDAESSKEATKKTDRPRRKENRNIL